MTARMKGFRLNQNHLIWGREAEHPERHRIDWDSTQVTVVDIHNLHDRAKRFVTGVVIKHPIRSDQEASHRAARDRIAEIYREIAQIEAETAARIERLRSELHAIDALVGTSRSVA